LKTKRKINILHIKKALTQQRAIFELIMKFLIIVNKEKKSGGTKKAKIKSKIKDATFA